MRFALGVDDDLRPFPARFAARPADRTLGAHDVRGCGWGAGPEPFEALVWAVCEQLIEYERAAAIERRLVHASGPALDGVRATRLRASGLRDLPTAATLGATAPAAIEACDLAAARALALRRAAREVARGHVDLHDPAEHELGWRRLRAIAGIGAWTVEMMALRGQGRHDQLPAGDLGLLKLVGRHLGGGDPKARAEEHEVREFFAGYGEWAGLAAVHAAGL